MKHVLKVFICIFTFGLSLYFYIDTLNAQTELKIKIPALMKEIEQIREENIHFAYEIECFKSPSNLLELAKRSEYAHLKFPYAKDVLEIFVNEREVLSLPKETEEDGLSGFKLPILLGSGSR